MANVYCHMVQDWRSKIRAYFRRKWSCCHIKNCAIWWGLNININPLISINILECVALTTPPEHTQTKHRHVLLSWWRELARCQGTNTRCSKLCTTQPLECARVLFNVTYIPQRFARLFQHWLLLCYIQAWVKLWRTEFRFIIILNISWKIVIIKYNAYWWAIIMYWINPAQWVACYALIAISMSLMLLMHCTIR